MKKLYLQDPLQADKLKFHHQELFDDLRDAKVGLLILLCAITVFEIIQSFALPGEFSLRSREITILAAVSYIIGCICYFLSISKYFENKSPNILKLRYFILFLAAFSYVTGIILGAYEANLNHIESNQPREFVLASLSVKSEIWIVLLLDLIIPIWPLKILVPLLFWLMTILQYYQLDIDSKETLWIKFCLSIVYIACIFALKAHIKWKSFLKNLNDQAWHEVQTSLLNKMPEP